MNRARRREAGFTLIELLVVIAIIAILAAILFPIFVSAKKRSQMTQCLGNLKQLSSAMNLYADDYSGRYPNDWPTSVNWCGCEAAYAWVYPRKGQIWPYTRNARIYLCPSDFGRPAPNITIVPSGLTSKSYPLSYAMNSKVGKRNPDIFPRPSKCMLLLHENRGEARGDYAINDGTYVPKTQDVPGAVHYDGTTLSYIDGHAVWKSRQSLLTESSSWW